MACNIAAGILRLHSNNPPIIHLDIKVRHTQPHILYLSPYLPLHSLFLLIHSDAARVRCCTPAIPPPFARMHTKVRKGMYSATCGVQGCACTLAEGGLREVCDCEGREGGAFVASPLKGLTSWAVLKFRL